MNLEAIIRVLCRDDTFFVGDRVVYAAHRRSGYMSSKLLVGMRGTILHISDHNLYGVEWDDLIGGHDMAYSRRGGKQGIKGRDGHCWYVQPNDIRLTCDA